MSSDRVIVLSRKPGPVHGYTEVHANLDGGGSGTFLVSDSVVGTQRELDEIRAQARQRTEMRDISRAGQD